MVCMCNLPHLYLRHENMERSLKYCNSRKSLGILFLQIIRCLTWPCYIVFLAFWPVLKINGCYSASGSQNLSFFAPNMSNTNYKLHIGNSEAEFSFSPLDLVTSESNDKTTSIFVAILIYPGPEIMLVLFQVSRFMFLLAQVC